MKVSEAVQSRRSIRQFLQRPVAEETLRQVLSQAARAPSGGNLQPWRLYVLSGRPLSDFRALMQKRLIENPQGDPVEYSIYPSNLAEPYRTQRFEVGEQLYRLIGVEREDRAGRLRQFARNFDFFGAPAAVFCYVDRSMGAAQWSDLGMYLQSLMLLLREQGLDSCAQECWSVHHRSVTEFVSAPENWMLFCGMAIGYADPDAPINRLHTERLPLDQFAEFLIS